MACAGPMNAREEGARRGEVAHAVRPQTGKRKPWRPNWRAQPAGQPADKSRAKSAGRFNCGHKSAVTSRARRELGLTDIWVTIISGAYKSTRSWADIWN